ncbi:MAG: cytochrome-c peroxidase [Methylocystis sp.]
MGALLAKLAREISRSLLVFFLVSSANAQNAEEEKLLIAAKAAFQPIKISMAPSDPISLARINLGRRLFFETRVSADGNISCAHCHIAEKHASDGLPKAIGVFGKENQRNAPTIFNAALNFKQHWRGDRETLEDQAEKSLLGPASFGNSDQQSAMDKLKAIPGYKAAFVQAFPSEEDPVTSKNWGRAIAAYERTLLSPSRFDVYLAGEKNALSSKEQSGLRIFIQSGCAGCHNGPGLGGANFQKFGVYEDYWKETGATQIDKGRADVTKNNDDLYLFKTPSLRNVAKTAPYFHDGSIADLTQAIHIMSKIQLNKQFSDDEAASIVAFLNSLTGDVPENYAPPEPFPDQPDKR